MEILHEYINGFIDGICVCNLRGDIKDTNKAFCRLLGYSQKRLLNMSIFDLETKHAPEKMQNWIEDAISIGQVRFKTEYKCKDGSFIDANVSVIFLQREKEGFLIFNVHDITQQERMKKLFQVHQHLFDILYRATEVPMLLDEYIWALKQMTDYKAVGICLFDNQGNLLYRAYDGFVGLPNELKPPISKSSNKCICFDVCCFMLYWNIAFTN